MKKTLSLCAGLVFACHFTVAQTTDEEEVDVKVTWDQCTGFMKTEPLRDIIKRLPVVDYEKSYTNIPQKDRKYKPHMAGIVDRGIPENNHIDPALQAEDGKIDGSGTLKASWQAQNGAFPPDPTGAAGPDHYVQAVNTTYRIYEKDGSALMPPTGLSSLWPGSVSDGDPIVMYDRFADRWFISQFQTGSNEILIAVSQTADPLGEYFLYEFTFTQFPDYPKFGVWSNAYYMTLNTSSNDCIAFERDAMLLGDATASKINMSFPSFYQFFNSVAPAYAEGPELPDADEPGYFFAVQDDSWPGVTSDAIKILKATINWDSPGSSSVTSHQLLTTTAFNSVFTTSWDDITQPGTSQKLDAVAGVFMYRAQYRRFDGYNVVMLCHTVDVSGTNRAGVRWYELRDANDGQWSIYQQGTYSPGSASRWMGNIAMDAQGNIALAYSYCSSADYPGLRYTGRFKDDALGQMTVQEQIAVEGDASQTTGNRYGDYSQMTMDPSDDMTFWFTGEYLGPTASRRTRIFSFSTWHLVGQEEQANALPFFNAYQPSEGQLRVVWNNLKDQQVTATIMDVEGRVIAKTDVNAENLQEDFDISDVAGGIYFVTLTGENTNLDKKIYVAK
jgi:hypothetical protein